MDSRPLTRGSVIDSRPLTRGSMGSRQKAFSAPVPLEFGLNFGAEPEEEGSATALEMETNYVTAGERHQNTNTNLDMHPIAKGLHG